MPSERTRPSLPQLLVITRDRRVSREHVRQRPGTSSRRTRPGPARVGSDDLAGSDAGDAQAHTAAHASRGGGGALRRCDTGPRARL